VSTFYNDAVTDYIFVPTENGFVRFTAMNTIIDTIIVAYSDTIEDYVPFGYVVEDGIGLNDDQKKEVEEIADNLIPVDTIKGKMLVNFGDSIAENRADSTSYAVLLKNLIEGDIYNYASGGSTVSRLPSQNMGCILSQVETYISHHSDVKTDIILINGGANDYSQSRNVGSVVKSSNHYAADDYDLDNFDETTYIGALEMCMQKLRNTFIDAVIVFVIPHKHNRLDDKWESMLDGAREVCKKWCVAVLDMDKDGQLNSRLPQMRIYTDEGGTHQNTLGNEKYYLPQLYNLLKKYFI
jgi:hypothetical protein